MLFIPNRLISRQGKSLDNALLCVVDRIMKKRRKGQGDIDYRLYSLPKSLGPVPPANQKSTKPRTKHAKVVLLSSIDVYNHSATLKLVIGQFEKIVRFISWVIKREYKSLQNCERFQWTFSKNGRANSVSDCQLFECSGLVVFLGRPTVRGTRISLPHFSRWDYLVIKL